MKIPLHAGHWSDPGPVVAWVKVDETDYAELAQYRWHLNDNGYASRTSRRDLPSVCPDCGWPAKPGQHAARSMANHRTKKHGIRTQGKQLTILMHRQILGLAKGDPRQGDHMNRDRLDNHRANLRVTAGTTQAQNQGPLKTFNGKPVESAYRGVYKIKKRGKWSGRWKVIVAGHYIGSFTSEEVAAEAAKQYRLRTMPFALD